jgi:hypothetical protein
MAKRDEDERLKELAYLSNLEKEVKFLREVVQKTNDPELTKALREASQKRSAPLMMDPDRDYKKEVYDMIKERFKGSKDPEFQVINGALVVLFPDYGPKYKLVLHGPMRRLRSTSKSLEEPRVHKINKSAHR